MLARSEPGEVFGYGELAELAGYPGAARAVGTLLRVTGEEVPWWRVVTASGRLAPGLEIRQSELLELEGVKVVRGRVVSEAASGGSADSASVHTGATSDQAWCPPTHRAD